MWYSFASYVDIPSMCIVAGGALLPVLATRGIQREQITEGLQRTLLPIGIMCSVVGCIHLLRNMVDPTGISSAIWFAALPTFYAVIFYSILAYNKKDVPNMEHIQPSIWGSVLLMIGLLSIFSVYTASAWIDVPAFLLMLLPFASSFYFSGRNPQKHLSMYLVQHSTLWLIPISLYSYFSLIQYSEDPTEIGPLLALGLCSLLYGSIVITWASLFVPIAQLRSLHRMQFVHLCSSVLYVWASFRLLEQILG